MRYGSIGANALWRFLIDASLLCDLIKWATLVVCQFNLEAYEVLPLKNIREPPQVKRKPGLRNFQDWKGTRFPKIGTNNYNPPEIEKHLPPKRESSTEKIAAQHPYLSPSKAKQVDKWVFRDTTTKDILQDEPNKRELGLKSTTAAPSVSSRDQEHLRSRTERPEGLKTRLTIMPDGELANKRYNPIFSQAPKKVDQSIGKRLEPTASSASTTDPKKNSVPDWLTSKPSYYHLLTREKQMKVTEAAKAAAISSSSAKLAKPIVPAGGAVSNDLKPAAGHPDNRPEPVDLLIDVEREVKPTSLRIEEMKEKIRSTYSSPTKTTVKSPSSSALCTDEPKTKGSDIPTPASSQLIDLDIPAPPLAPHRHENSQPEKKRYFFNEILDLRPEIPKVQKFNAQAYNLQKREYMFNRLEMRDAYWQRSAASRGRTNSHGPSSGTSNGTPRGGTVSSVPPTRPISITPGHCRLESRDTHLRLLAERDNRPSSTPAPGLSGPRCPIFPVDTLIVPPLNAAGSTRDVRSVERPEDDQPRLPLKEEEKALLKKLQDIIKKEYTGGADSVTDKLLDISTQSDDDGLSAPGPQVGTSFSTLSASTTAPTTVIDGTAASQRRRENVPFLHPDLIDLSPQGLMTNFHRDAVRRLDQSPSDEDDKPEVSEKIADTKETKARGYHETMFHQKPAGITDFGLDGVGQEPQSERHQNSRGNISGRTTTNAGDESKETRAPQPLNTAAKLSKERQALVDSTRNLFNSLGPLLNRVRSFPGTLTLEIQLGLMFILNVTASTQENEMTYKEVQNLFFSQHSLQPPRTSFFDRLTSSPADIDYLIGLKINEKPLFDQHVNLRSIKYEFHCRASPNKIFIISVDQERNITLRHPRVHLGAVSMSFPAQVWDACAVMQGSTNFNLKSVPGLENALREMIGSIWIDPERDGFQMLLRPPSTEIMTISAVFVERRTSHRWISEQSKRIYLKVTETQIPNMTPSIVDPKILVVKSAPHEEMIKHGKRWWQASITSAEVEQTLRENMKIRPGTRNDAWNAADLFGEDIKLINPATELSALGSSVGHSGIGAMFRLARIVVENVDAIGFFNNGPAAHVTKNTTDRGVSAGAISGGARSGSIAKSQDLRNMALVKWNPSAELKRKKGKW